MRLAFLGVLTLLSLAYGQETCQSADEEPYLLFGTKTAYTFASAGIPLNKAYDVPGKFNRFQMEKLTLYFILILI